MKKIDQSETIKTAEDRNSSQRMAALATLTLVDRAQVRAQDDDGEDEDFSMDAGRSGRFVEEEDMDFNDMPMQFSYRRYRHELNSLLWMAVALFAVNKLIHRRHRRGCSFIVVFVFVVYYVLSHVLRLL